MTRMKTALKELENMVHQRKREEHPGMPEYAIPKSKFRDTNTNGLTQAILACFKAHDIWATRIDSKGTYNQALKRFIPSNQKKGLPDVFAQAPGLPPIWVEVKCEATRDRLKPHQAEVIEQLRRSGAIVYIAINFEDFYQWFRTDIVKTTISKDIKETAVVRGNTARVPQDSITKE